MLAHLWTNWRPGDALFVSERAQYPLRYYVECRCGDLPEPARDISWRSAKIPLSRTDQYAPALASRPPGLVVSEAGASRFAEARAVSSLLGRRRVWVLMTSKDAGERGLLTYLSCIGRRTDAFVRRAGTGGFKTPPSTATTSSTHARALATARCTGERRDVVRFVAGSGPQPWRVEQRRPGFRSAPRLHAGPTSGDARARREAHTSPRGSPPLVRVFRRHPSMGSPRRGRAALPEADATASRRVFRAPCVEGCRVRRRRREDVTRLADAASRRRSGAGHQAAPPAGRSSTPRQYPSALVQRGRTRSSS